MLIRWHREKLGAAADGFNLNLNLKYAAAAPGAVGAGFINLKFKFFSLISLMILS